MLKVERYWVLFFSFHRPLYTLWSVHLHQLLSAGFGRAAATGEFWTARPHTHVLRLVPGLGLSLLCTWGGLWHHARTRSSSCLSSATSWVYRCILHDLETPQRKHCVCSLHQPDFKEGCGGKKKRDKTITYMFSLVLEINIVFILTITKRTYNNVKQGLIS